MAENSLSEHGKHHTVHLVDRENLTVTAVNEVLSFDDETVSLDVAGGIMIVSGKQLAVISLTGEGGDICIKGRVEAIAYTSAKKSKGIFAGLFK